MNGKAFCRIGVILTLTVLLSASDLSGKLAGVATLQTGTQYELVVDGGFELGSLCRWGNAGSLPAMVTDDRSSSGRHSVLLGGPERGLPSLGGNAIVWPVKIPATARSAMLSFDYYTFASRNAPDDYQRAGVSRPTLSGAIQNFIFERSNNRSWETMNIDLLSFRGQVVTSVFEVLQESFGTRTGMYVDNISIRVDDPAPTSLSKTIDVFPNPILRRQDAEGFLWFAYIYITNNHHSALGMGSVNISLLDSQRRIVRRIDVAAFGLHGCPSGSDQTIPPKGSLYGVFALRLPNNLPEGFVTVATSQAESVTVPLLGG